MEEYKRKFLVEPLQEQGTSKYGRKVSKFVFKVVQNNIINNIKTEPVVQNNIKPDPVSSSEHYSHSIPETNDASYPSIVLCRPDSPLSDSMLEQQFDITPHSIIKKMKIIPSSRISKTPSKTKLKLYKPRGKLKTISNEKKEKEAAIPSQSLLNKNIGRKIPNVIKDNADLQVQRSRTLASIEENEQTLINDKIQVEEIRLKAEHERLSTLLNELKVKAQKVLEIESYQKERITLTKLKQNHEMLYYYIGFKDISLLDSMVINLSEYFTFNEKTSEELLLEDQLILVLMKLRRNYSMHDLAFRFRITVSEADCIVFNVILALHHIYYEKDLKEKSFPSIESMKNSLPDQFKNFQNCRVVLECVKIGCEDPDHESDSDILTSSKFDPKITLKGLLGISPTKHVLFASGLYEESISNTHIFQDSQILAKIQAGDLIMSDKSFEISDCIPTTIELNVPANSLSNLTDKQIKNLNSKARAFIGRTTMQHIRRFCILNHIPIFLNSIAIQVFQLCAALVNFQPTITNNAS